MNTPDSPEIRDYYKGPDTVKLWLTDKVAEFEARIEQLEEERRPSASVIAEAKRRLFSRWCDEQAAPGVKRFVGYLLTLSREAAGRGAL